MESKPSSQHLPQGTVENDIYIFSHENVLEQIKTARYELGYYILKFYTKDGKPSKEPTDTISEFYLYPTGGTLRDSSMNLVFYDPRYDIYRGFKPPHVNKEAKKNSTTG